MIKGTTKKGDKVRISTRTENGRVLIALSVIYANGGGFASMAESIDEAKVRMETLLGKIQWSEEPD